MENLPTPRKSQPVPKMDDREAIRIKICEQVAALIKPFAESWGVTIINFQLNSFQLADKKYAQDYEAASLEIAKAKANLQASIARNKMVIQQAQINGEAQKNKSRK